MEAREQMFGMCNIICIRGQRGGCACSFILGLLLLFTNKGATPSLRLSQGMRNRGSKCLCDPKTLAAYIEAKLLCYPGYGLDLFLLSIDEGITGYRDDSLETVKRNEATYGIPLLCILCAVCSLCGVHGAWHPWFVHTWVTGVSVAYQLTPA
eukprot:1159650-Pelagomonas_calceolata.AAC.15